MLRRLMEQTRSSEGHFEHIRVAVGELKRTSDFGLVYTTL